MPITTDCKCKITNIKLGCDTFYKVTKIIDLKQNQDYLC